MVRPILDFSTSEISVRKFTFQKKMVRRVHMAGIFNVTTGRLHTSIISAKRRKESRERVQKKVSTLDLLAILARSFQQQR
jgi:hypothetical protein